MNARQWLMTGCIALIIPAAVLAQPGGRGGRGGFGGGGFGGAPGGFGGGGFGGGGGFNGGGGFSSRGMSADPDQMFNRWSRGKDTIDLNSMNETMRSFFERALQGMGITAKDGKITREDFRAASEKMKANGDAGGFAGRRGRGGSSSIDADAEAAFNKMDTDHDGQLKAEEMTGPFGESLLAERDKWDTDQDKFITLAEFKPFYAARIQQKRDERRNDGPDRSARDDRNSNDGNSDRRPVVVYRSNSLPKDIPSWFAQLDTDQDAQISLYEWRQSQRPLEEFKAMDRSGDNLLTVEEVLLYVRLEKMNNSIASNGADNGNKPAQGGPAMFNMGGGPGGGINFNMGGPGGFNRQGMGRFPGANGPGAGNGGSYGFPRAGRGNDNGDGNGGMNGFGGRGRRGGNSGGDNEGGSSGGGRGGRRGGNRGFGGGGGE